MAASKRQRRDGWHAERARPEVSTRCWPRSPGRAGGSSSTRTSRAGRSSPISRRRCPLFFKTFCALNADVEAVVAGDERLTFADLDAISDRLARGLVARGIGKGDRVGIAMRNCPAWIVAYMAVVKAGAVATLLNGWWQPTSWSMRCS